MKSVGSKFGRNQFLKFIFQASVAAVVSLAKWHSGLTNPDLVSPLPLGPPLTTPLLIKVKLCVYYKLGNYVYGPNKILITHRPKSYLNILFLDNNLHYIPETPMLCLNRAFEKLRGPLRTFERGEYSTQVEQGQRWCVPNEALPKEALA